MTTKKKLTDFEVNPKLTMPSRVAQFLDFAAKHFPYTPVPYNLMYRCVMGFDRTPRMGGDEVRLFRGKMSDARIVLRENFGRDLLTVPGVGARATVDSADTVKNALPLRVRRLKGASAAVVNTAALVDPALLPSDSAFAPWKRWFNSDVRGLVKQINGTDYLTRLLPPGQTSAAPAHDVPKKTGTGEK